MNRIGVLIFIVLTPAICAEEPTDQALVDQLVSSNPTTTGVILEHLPQNWSVEEDDRVWKIFQKIKDRGSEIIPALIKNFDRKEFSTTISGATPYWPASIGHMCQKVIEDIFDPVHRLYKVRERGNGKVQAGQTYFSWYLTDKNMALQWWESHKTKTRIEIQTEIRDWHIQRERKFGFDSKEDEERILKLIDTRFRRAMEPKHEE